MAVVGANAGLVARVWGEFRNLSLARMGDCFAAGGVVAAVMITGHFGVECAAWAYFRALMEPFSLPLCGFVWDFGR